MQEEPDVFRRLSRVKEVLTPGPTSIPEDVRRAASIPPFPHNTEIFSEIYMNIEKLLRPLIGASRDEVILLMSGSSTLGLESVILNSICPKDKVLVIKHGFFSNLLEDIVKRYSANVDVIESRWGSIPQEDKVLGLIENGDYDFICLVHCDTSTGTTIRYLDRLCRVAKKYSSYVILDAVSTVGSEFIEVSNWGIDALVTGPQKCLGSYPGVAIVSLSRELVEIIERKDSLLKKPFYMDLMVHIKYKEECSYTPTTPPVNNVYALLVGLLKIHRFGIDNYIKLHEDRAKEVYEYVEDLGLSILAKDRSIRSYSVAVLEIENAVEKVRKLEGIYGYLVSTGLGQYRNSLVRIGMMGFINTELIKEVISKLRSI